MPNAVAAAGGVLQYVRTTQKQALAQMTSLSAYSTETFMALDQFTRRNLELHETIRQGKARGSLLGILDRTQTGMGARLLRKWISQPLLEIARLNARLDAVEALVESDILRDELSDVLKQVGDLERLVTRITLDRAGPRDLIALKIALESAPRMRALIAGSCRAERHR